MRRMVFAEKNKFQPPVSVNATRMSLLLGVSFLDEHSIELRRSKIDSKVIYEKETVISSNISLRSVAEYNKRSN